MSNLTEQQERQILSTCERIQELCKQQDKAMRNITRIFENVAAGRNPEDGIEK